jgi:hypothetical protein
MPVKKKRRNRLRLGDLSQSGARVLIPAVLACSPPTPASSSAAGVPALACSEPVFAGEGEVLLPVVVLDVVAAAADVVNSCTGRFDQRPGWPLGMRFTGTNQGRG